MPLDPRRRFSATVGRYTATRPSYPPALVDWTLALGPVRRVIDLGAGTGISSRLWAARGVEVVGIEPNDEMRAAAQAAGGGPSYRKGDAEATGLPAAFGELVIACQAFHWFDLDRALLEIDRVLVPGGHAVAAWNDRARSPLMDGYRDLLAAHLPPDEQPPSFPATIAALRARRPGAREVTFPNAQRLDRAGLHDRAWSASYVVHGVTDSAAFDHALDALFDACAEDGQVTFAYETRAIAWASPS